MKRKLLIIEDEEVVRNNLKLFLDVKGYDVACAASSTEGFKLLESFKPKLLLLDLHLKEELTGIDIIKRVKSVSPATKVIVATGFGAEEGVEEKCLGAGADKFLWKPLTPAELKEELDKV